MIQLKKSAISPLKPVTPPNEVEKENDVEENISVDGFTSPKSGKRGNYIPKADIFSIINSFLD